MIKRETLGAAILSTGSDAIVATDRDGLIQFWNPGAERIFGHSRGEAVGQSLDLIIPEHLRARHWQGYRQVMQTGESSTTTAISYQFPASARTGRASRSSSRSCRSRTQAEVEGMLALMRDVTQRFEEMRALRKELAERTGGER